MKTNLYSSIIMKLKINLCLCIILFPIFVHSCFAQDNYVSNVRTTISDDQKLFVNFDLASDDGTEYFNVELKLLYNGEPFEPDPDNLFGDYGHAMTAGEKIIYWDYGDEFKGNIEEVEVKVLASREKEPQAKFTSSAVNNDYYAPCTIQFDNRSENSDKYEWNFGDAASGAQNTSLTENPEHTYKKRGRYTVSLTAYNTELNIKNTFYETIVVKESEPKVTDIKPKTTLSDYEKHKRMKTIWIGAAGATTVAGTVMLLKANSLYNDYKTAKEDAEDIRHKYETLDKIYPFAFAAAIFSGVEIYIQAKKQSKTVAALKFQSIPEINGGMITMKVSF